MAIRNLANVDFPAVEAGNGNMRESYPLQLSEEYITVAMPLNPAEQRLMERLRRLIKEQNRGCLLMFEEGGFVIYRLSDRNTA